MPDYTCSAKIEILQTLLKYDLRGDTAINLLKEILEDIS